jgi:hypothetical protein
MDNNLSTQKKSKISFNALIILVCIIIVVGGIIGIQALFDDTSSNTDNVAITISSNADDDDISEEFSSGDMLDSVSGKRQTIKKYKIGNTNSSAAISREVGKLNDLAREIETLSKAINEGEQSSELSQQIKKLKHEMNSLKTSTFPQLRLEYARVASQKMQNDSIEAIVSGSGNTTITFIGERYVDTANVDVDYALLQSYLLNLHFKNAIFKANENATASKEFQINSPADTDISEY